MIAYRMEVRTPEQMAADDPFEGRGIFLPAPGGTGEIIGRVMEALGWVPAVSWPDRGAWVDLTDTPWTEQDARRAWDEADGGTAPG